MGLYDIFIAKYDGNGNEIWAKSAGNNLWEGANAITADTFGKIYVAGFFNSSSLIVGLDILINNSGSNDIFIAKYDSSGNVIWAKSAEGNGADWVRAIISDKNSNTYLTGSFSGNSLVFNTDTLVNNGLSNAFITKFDSLGNTVWAKNSCTQNGAANALSSDIFGNIYVAGCFRDTIIIFDFDTFDSFKYNLWYRHFYCKIRFRRQ